MDLWTIEMRSRGHIGSPGPMLQVRSGARMRSLGRMWEREQGKSPIQTGSNLYLQSPVDKRSQLQSRGHACRIGAYEVGCYWLVSFSN